MIGHMIWKSFAIFGNLVLGGLVGIALLLWVSQGHPDSIYERWEFTDTNGQVWNCHRFLRTKASCHSSKNGLLYMDAMQEPSPCVVEERRWLESFAR